MTDRDPAADALRRATGSTPRASTTHRKRGPAISGDPQLIGAGVERLLADQGWHDRVAVARLMQEWPDIVGPDVAAHVEPVGFHEGELTLQADSTAWATQVRLLIPTLRRAIDQQVGDGTVRRVEVLAPKAPSWIAGPRRVKGRGPRDTYG